MGAFICIISPSLVEVGTDRGVYGSPNPSSERNRWGVKADLFAMKRGDLVFFYVRQEKTFLGPYKIKETVLDDPSTVAASSGESVLDNKYPFRFTFEPHLYGFSNYLQLDDVADLIEKKTIWSFPHPITMERTRGARSVNPITLDEARELIHLFLRDNPIMRPARPMQNPYVPATLRRIKLDLDVKANGNIRFESNLQAWFNAKLARREPKILNLIGEHSEFLTGVPAGEKRIDILCIHSKPPDKYHLPKPYLFTVIELMTGRGDFDHLNRLLYYRDWVIDRLAGGNRKSVQSVLVAKGFKPEVIRATSEIGWRSRIILVEYDARAISGDVTLQTRFP